MDLFVWAVFALAAVGHFAFCVGIFNRLHGLALNRRVRRFFEVLLVIFFWTAPAWMAIRWYDSGPLSAASLLALAYLAWCCATALMLVPFWLAPRLWPPTVPALVSNDTARLNVVAEMGPIPLHGFEARLLGSLPYNEIFQLHIPEKSLRLPRWRSSSPRFSVLHLTDLHLTGDMGCAFYEYIARKSNELEPDVVMITGDIIESADCLPWLEKSLLQLNAKFGKYFIFGNHDLLMPSLADVRQMFEEAGFVYLGGRVVTAQWNDVPVVLAGDERPWLVGPNEKELSDASGDPHAFRILAAHSPDRYAWARRQQFDLMLAGHNHGGQVRFPVIGPLISPSITGTRYASGVFHESPTLLHVSRGLAGEHPLRWNCAPELANLVLLSDG